MESPAAALSRGLAEQVEAVCKHYLSNGCRSGNYWIVGDVNNHPGRSLYVRLKGPLSGKGARGRWADGATLEHGDLLDLIAARENLGSFKATLDEARRFLKQPRETPPARSDERAPNRDTVAAARKIWAASRPIHGTPAEAYLRARKITTDLDSASLRYHPSLFYRERPGALSRTYPALVAAVTNHRGEITGAHRTFLDPARKDKASVPSPRRSLGAILGNGVCFGKIEDVVLVGEGIETVLSIKSALPELPMIAALSASHLAAWKFPPGLRRLIVACDNDAAGWQAARRLTKRAEAAGVLTTTITSLRSDFNSDLRAMSAGAFQKQLAALLGPDRDCG
ncbi:MAG: toprim domain-containing protein [Methylocystis sp.]|nr:toprim domain-containing protein [Methylocystis sp.]